MRVYQRTCSIDVDWLDICEQLDDEGKQTDNRLALRSSVPSVCDMLKGG